MAEKIILIGLLSLLRAGSMLQISTGIFAANLFFTFRAIAQPLRSASHRTLQTVLSAMASLWLLTTYYWLLTTCVSLPTTYYLLPTYCLVLTTYSLLTTYYSLPTACYIAPTIHDLLLDTC